MLRPGGVLLVEFASATGAVQEFLTTAARRRFLPMLLRRPSYYLIDEVLATGQQRFDPKRLARWEFQFFTPAKARAALEAQGFRPYDVMTVAPVSAFQPAIAASARRETRTWTHLLEIEETIGRRPEVLESGHGFLVAAEKRGAGAPKGAPDR